MQIDIAEAEKKLRQANFFLAHLHQAAHEISMQVRGSSAPNAELLDGLDGRNVLGTATSASGRP